MRPSLRAHLHSYATSHQVLRKINSANLVKKESMNKMQTNVKILGWIYIITGLLGLLAGILTFVILAIIGLVANEREALVVLTLVGTGVVLLSSFFSLPSVIAGIGLLNFRSWGRVLAIVLGFLSLFAFPIGTVLGIYTIVSLLNEEAGRLFARRQLA